MRLKTLIYVSKARAGLTDGDFNSIYQSARHLNALDGVTGVLVFNGCHFLQIIEGAETAIDALLERLLNDPRHSELRICDQRFVEERSFPNWSMEWVRTDQHFPQMCEKIDAILPETTSAAVRNQLLNIAEQIAA